QIHKNLFQQHRIAPAGRQIEEHDLNPRIDFSAEVLQGLRDQVRRVDGLFLQRLAAETRKSEEVVDQFTHLQGVIPNHVEIVLRLASQLRRALLNQYQRKDVDGSQRRPQIVRYGVGE